MSATASRTACASGGNASTILELRHQPAEHAVVGEKGPRHRVVTACGVLGRDDTAEYCLINDFVLGIMLSRQHGFFLLGIGPSASKTLKCTMGGIYKQPVL